MLGIEPEAVVAPRQAKELDADGVDQASRAENAHHLVACQQAFEKSGHCEGCSKGLFTFTGHDSAPALGLLALADGQAGGGRGSKID
jgi:hypothetical protein